MEYVIWRLDAEFAITITSCLTTDSCLRDGFCEIGFSWGQFAP